MKWIDSGDLEGWAKRFEAKGDFPLLISRLVRATSSGLLEASFPSGRNVYFDGWDGIVKTSESSEFTPAGISLWELGTEANPRKKAEKDYIKRTQDPLGQNPLESTLILVTPYVWKGRAKWRREKLREGSWKDILVYDAVSLEDWLQEAPSVGLWLVKKIKYPPDGFQSTEDFWKE